MESSQLAGGEHARLISSGLAVWAPLSSSLAGSLSTILRDRATTVFEKNAVSGAK
jgi:hypothetical protein